MPLFYSSINDITTILNFFKKSNEKNKDYLDTFSSYIGRVLGSALWEDDFIEVEIYNDKNLISLIEKVKEPQNILQGIKNLCLKFGKSNDYIGPLRYVLAKRLPLLKKIKKIKITEALSITTQDLDQMITNNNTSIKKISIQKQNNINELLDAIFSCSHLKELEIVSNLFKLTPRLGDLIQLESLRLSANQKEGPISSWLKKLTNLKTLNQKEGPIPSWLRKLTNLKTLILSDNNFPGSIPLWLSELTHLETLNLFKNKLKGLIPKELRSLSNLKCLILSDNQLTGSIPFSLGDLTNLKMLILSNNQLTGSIPSSLGDLTNLKLLLKLSNNQLTGFIPKNLKKYSENINPQIKIIQGKEIEYNLLVDYK